MVHAEVLKQRHHGDPLKIGLFEGLRSLFFSGDNCLKSGQIGCSKTAKSTSSWWLTLKVARITRCKSALLVGDNYIKMSLLSGVPLALRGLTLSPPPFYSYYAQINTLVDTCITLYGVLGVGTNGHNLIVIPVKYIRLREVNYA